MPKDDEDRLYKNILAFANSGWQTIMKDERKYVFKKEHPRDSMQQLFYKISKYFTETRDPTNFLRLCDAKNEDWIPLGKRQNVMVKLQVTIVPLTAPVYDQVNRVIAELDVLSQTVGSAKLALFIQGKHFYDDQASHECSRLARQVQEKYGARYFSDQHQQITKWRPTKAFDFNFLKKQLNTTKLADIYRECIDIEPRRKETAFREAGYWNT